MCLSMPATPPTWCRRARRAPFLRPTSDATYPSFGVSTRPLVSVPVLWCQPRTVATALTRKVHARLLMVREQKLSIDLDCTNATSAYFVPPLRAFDSPPSAELMEFVTPETADPIGLFVDWEPLDELDPGWESGAPSEVRNTLSLGPGLVLSVLPG